MKNMTKEYERSNSLHIKKYIEKELSGLNAMLSEGQAFNFTKTFVELIKNSFLFTNVKSVDITDEGDTGSLSDRSDRLDNHVSLIYKNNRV